MFGFGILDIIYRNWIGCFFCIINFFSVVVKIGVFFLGILGVVLFFIIFFTFFFCGTVCDIGSFFSGFSSFFIVIIFFSGFFFLRFLLINFLVFLVTILEIFGIVVLRGIFVFLGRVDSVWIVNFSGVVLVDFVVIISKEIFFVLEVTTLFFLVLIVEILDFLGIIFFVVCVFRFFSKLGVFWIFVNGWVFFFFFLEVFLF